MQIDVLNAEQQNEILNSKLKQLQDDQDEKDKEVNAEERKIKEKHNIIQKKQHKVDRLNRELGDEQNKQGKDESKGPLEAIKNNLNKQNNEKEDEIQDIQKEWIGNQTKLVAKQIKQNDMINYMDELRTKKVILDQKKLRLN